MITPLCEEAVEAFAKSITDHVSSTVLVLASDLSLFLGVECLSVSDSNVNFIFDSTTCELVLRMFSVVAERVVDVMHKVLLIMFSKLNRCNILMQQVPVEPDLVPPCFDVLVEHPLSLLLRVSQNAPHLLEDLGEIHLLSCFHLKNSNSAGVVQS